MEIQVLERIIAHIEANLREDKPNLLDSESLARVAGLSVFHFLREFHSAVGVTAADYIRKRRISEIVKRMGEDRPMSDIAFEYGFNSKENFTRAFKKEHGILPSAYKKADCSLRLYEPFRVSSVDLSVRVSMGYLHTMELTVYRFGSLPPPKCWNLYNSESRSLLLSGGKITPDYGVMKYSHQEKALHYWIGIRTEEAITRENDVERLTIPEGLYAIFETPPATQHAFSGVIRKTWDWIGNVWLPQSGYARRDSFELERYAESSKAFTETIFVPIERKHTNG